MNIYVWGLCVEICVMYVCLHVCIVHVRMCVLCMFKCGDYTRWDVRFMHACVFVWEGCMCLVVQVHMDNRDLPWVFFLRWCLPWSLDRVLHCPGTVK